MTAVSEFSTDLEGAGTPESVWLAAPSLRTAKRWRPVLPRSGRVVVVAPHPDDEILGAGGTVARLMSLGAHHVAVAVTDGEASHHGRAPELREVRPAESFAAAQALGIVPDVTHRLRAIVHDEFVADPAQRGRMRLDGVVVVPRRGVDAVHFHRRVGQ